MDGKRLLIEVVGKADDEQRLVIGWAYVCKREDGSIVEDDGGVTWDADGKMVSAPTAGDRIDTPEAIDAFKLAFYRWLGAGSAKSDDMHVDFAAGNLVGGVFFDEPLIEAMGLGGKLKVGPLVVIHYPDTIKGNAAWAKVKAGERPQLSIVFTGHREEIAEAA